VATRRIVVGRTARFRVAFSRLRPGRYRATITLGHRRASSRVVVLTRR
jgi:hypothetical protein